MRSMAAHSVTIALALLILASFSDGLPWLEGSGKDVSVAIAGLNGSAAWPESLSLTQALTTGLFGSEEVEEGGRGAAKPQLRVPKTCPRAGCSCKTAGKGCPGLRCCAQGITFDGCQIDRLLMKACPTGTGQKLPRKLCVSLGKYISTLSSLIGLLRKGAVLCPSVRPYNNVAKGVLSDIKRIQSRCC